MTFASARHGNKPMTRDYWAAELVHWLLWQTPAVVKGLTPDTLPKRYMGVGRAKRAEILGAEQARREAGAA